MHMAVNTNPDHDPKVLYLQCEGSIVRWGYNIIILVLSPTPNLK